MAHFRGTVEGQTQEVSRLGNAKSGIHITASGWDIGVEAHGREELGKDVFNIYINGGSNHGKSPRKIASVWADGSIYLYTDKESQDFTFDIIE